MDNMKAKLQVRRSTMKEKPFLLERSIGDVPPERLYELG